MHERRFVVIGAGPAGLAAAHRLTSLGHRPLVVEKSAALGGLARTAEYRGYRFDMGGHRFFTKSAEVERFWTETLGDDFVVRPRLSRIFYRGRFFKYPLEAMNALAGLGPLETLRVAGSYLYWRLFPHAREDTFEEWVTNRFGRRLFRIFFESYTEKVWGLPCSEIRAEWAAQRIRNLSLGTVLRSLLWKPGRAVRSLIEEFHYPRLGPGMMWEAVAREISRRGGEVLLNGGVRRIERKGNRITHVVVGNGDGGGRDERIAATDFISSMPIGEFVARLDPPAPDAVRAASAHLRHRAFLTVCLVVDAQDLFPDNWIYVHDPSVRVARIQNFGNWSPDMVPEPGRTSLGLEYFCNEGDAVWTMADADLVAMGRSEIERIGLARADQVVDGCVFRVPAAYPIYDASYAAHLRVVRDFVDGLENCRMAGRNGLHRYNNQDHAMLTGFEAARSLASGEPGDVWGVSDDPEYFEEAAAAKSPSTRRGAGLAPLLKHAAAALFVR